VYDPHTTEAQHEHHEKKGGLMSKVKAKLHM